MKRIIRFTFGLFKVSILTANYRRRILTTSASDSVSFNVRHYGISNIRPAICVSSLKDHFNVFMVTRRRVNAFASCFSYRILEIKEICLCFRTNNYLTAENRFRYFPTTKAGSKTTFHRSMYGNVKRACLLRRTFRFNVRQYSSSSCFVRVATRCFRYLFTRIDLSFVISGKRPR